MDLKLIKIEFVENIDWTKLWYIAGILAAFWGGLAGITIIYPAFDGPYKVVNIILGAVVGAALFAARGGKYVSERKEPPQGGQV